MTITALSGPIIQFPQGTVSGQPSGQNPEAGPSMFPHATSLLDVRDPFTYHPGQNFGTPTYGWLSTTCLTIDQVPTALAANNIAAAQSVTTAVAMTLRSANVTGITVGQSITNASTGATVTGLIALDTKMGSVTFGSAATVNIWDPAKAVARNIRVTTNADDSLGTYTVAGYDIYGYPMTEAITGVNNTVASGKKAFKYIASVTPGGTIASTSVTVGTGDVIGLPLRADTWPLVQAWWNGGLIGGAAPTQTITMPMQLSDIADSQQWKMAVPFAFRVTSALFRTGKPASASNKLTTLTVQINGSSVTGGAMALTTANQNATGGTVAATTISAGNTGTAGQTIGVVASSTTAFTEGDGWVEFTVTNLDGTGSGFVAADTTSPATTTTGDVRGTIALPSASDGTKRLTVQITMAPSLVNNSTGMFGVTQV